jgi:hypothetical protein
MMSRFTYLRSCRSASPWPSPIVSVLFLTLTACAGDPQAQSEREQRVVISSQGAALTAVQNTEIALKGVVDSGSFLADSTSLAETLNTIGGSSTTCESSGTACNATDAVCPSDTTEVCSTDEITPEELQEARDDIRREVDDFVTFLREEVFIEANLVADETTETQVTYHLGPEVLCRDQLSADAPSDPTVTPAPVEEPARDPECVANAAKANLRIRLTQPRANDVDLSLIVSDDDFEPLIVQLYHDRIGIKVDLAEGLKTLEAMGENVEEVTSLTGVLQLQLIKNAPIDYSLQFSILDDVALSLEGENGEQYAYSIVESSPTIDLRADGNTKTVSASYNYGAIQILGPFSKFVQMYLDKGRETDAAETTGDALPLPAEPTYTGVVELLLSGYTGTLSYQAESDTFSFSDVSLGATTSTLKHNGNVLAALDLNPNDGRKFNATIRPETLSDGSTSALVTLDPTIDVNLALNFSHVADQVPDLDPTLLNDKLRVWFTGEDPSLVVEKERIRMTSGALHMTSEQNPEANVEVAQGMCLAQNDTVVQDPSETAPAESLFGVSVAACE